MNHTIKQSLTNWYLANPAIKHWSWFIVLWMGGLVAALATAYPIKLLIRYMQ